MKALLFPFSLTNQSIATTTSNDEIVRAQVIDALMTNQGERAFRAEYGCDIQAALFDPSDELVRNDAANFISIRLQRYAPRAVIISVKIESPNTEPGVLYIHVNYRPSTYRDAQTLRVPITSEFLHRAASTAIGDGSE